MNFYEFVTDESVELNLNHYFGGILFNRIPLLKKLKWREVASFKCIWGNLSKENYYLYPKNSEGRIDVNFRRLDPDIPYLEISYGIENIGFRLFRFIRIDAIHRLTYRTAPKENPGLKPIKFGIKATGYFKF
jgi:hypothetical protein